MGILDSLKDLPRRPRLYTAVAQVLQFCRHKLQLL